MVSKTIQNKYNLVIDNVAYLIVHYPEPLKKLLADHGISFEGKLTHKDLSDAVIEQLEEGNIPFQNSLEQLILKLSKAEEDDGFIGTLITGAVGLVGGIIKRKQARRSARRASRAAAKEEQAYAASQARSSARAQAAQAKRDLQIRMERMREQRKKEQEAEKRRAEERRRREEQQKREAEAKKKTNMMLMVGGGIAVLGIGAVVLMKSNRPAMPYPQMRPPTMPME